MPASFDNGTNLETGGLSDVWWAICRPREFVLGGDESGRAGKAALERHRARHILTPPYTPRWNGKVERFIQTLKREWAYALVAELNRAHQGPGILPSLLQPATPPQLAG